MAEVDEVHESREAPVVEPLDEHNARLVAQVHPPGWVDPEPAGRYHLVVVGAGTAGLVSAAGAAGLGARVALVERHLMGGDCLNVGCVPSKAVIRAARAWHEAATAAARFGAPPVAPSSADGGGRFAAVMERMRRLRADLARVDGAARFQGLGVDVFLGHGRFVAPDALEVNGRRLAFRRAVIATGARAAGLPIDGLDEAGYRTNETVFELTELPPRLAVVGGGPIGCELAQAFARFGSRVTLLEVADRILIKDDPDAAAVVHRALEADGVRIELGVKISRVRRDGPVATLTVGRDGGESFEVAAEEILLAAGRAPNVEGLGLDAAGVGWSKKGIEVDDRLRTANKRIYAAGDVASKYQFTHAADAMARMVIQNALFYGRKKAGALARTMPWCTYTSPELAHVGLSADEARERGHEVDTLTQPLAEVDRAVLDGAAEGFLRLHLVKGKDEILGATLVAEHAGDLIAEVALAISAGVGLGAVAGTIHPYPTQAEVFKRAADAWRRGKLTPAVKKLFAAWFRVFG
jgi:pyruvate/2-oxoglutarate dehydrogenase complex dihydrolipoamide dehydrogenase (E3) component